MKHMFTTRLLACLAFLALLWPLTSTAAPFTPGNLVVVRVGDGSAALASAATATFLVEYTPAGTVVQTIALPTSASGLNRALTLAGTSTAEGQLTRSVDGRFLILAGYDAATGTADITNTTATATNRVVGRVAADGTINTSTTINDAFGGTSTTTGSIRGAASVDGSSFWAAGSVSGVRYVTLGNTGASTQLNTAPTNIRYVNIAGGNLYVSSGSAATLGVSQIGTGLPTTTGQTNTGLTGAGTATGSSTYAFFFADLSATVPGVDVLYLVDDRAAASSGGIQKYSLVGNSWTLNGTIAGGTLRGLTGSVNGSSVTLGATSASGLYILSDATGYNVAPTVTLPATAQATAGTNMA